MQHSSNHGTKRAASVSVDELHPSAFLKNNPPKKKRVQTEEEKVFMELLSDRGVDATMKWGEARELVEDDPRFIVIATTGAKRQLFAEWTTQARKRQAIHDREQKRLARLDDPGFREFMELLYDKGVEPTPMKWKAVQKLIKKDQRYDSLPTEADRKQALAEWNPDMQKTVERLIYKTCDEDNHAGTDNSLDPCTERHDVSSLGLVDWLRKLDNGHGSMLEYLNFFDAEFDGNLHDAVAAAKVEASTHDWNPCDRIDASFWERIPVDDDLHRLLLAESIISMSEKCK